MIPSFPLFKKLTRDDRAAVEVFTVPYGHYSDFNFVSMLANESGAEYEVSQLNNNLVVRFTDDTTRKPFLSFIGIHESGATARTLLDYAATMGMPPLLRLIPETTAALITSPDLAVTEDRAHFDYVYSMAVLADRADPRTKKVCSRITDFTTAYPQAVCTIDVPFTPEAHASVSSVIQLWEDRKTATNKNHIPTQEEASVRTLFQESMCGELLLTGIYIDGHMRAFSIDEIIDGYCMGHFWKADTSYEGVYEFLTYTLAQHLRDRGTAHWNWKQDLGIEGLRRYKQKYPVEHFLKKYSIQTSASL